MTVPNEDTGYTSGAQQTDAIELDPIPVHIVKTTSRRQAAQFGSLSYCVVPADTATNVPVQVLQRRPTRDRAIIYNPVSVVNAPVILSNTLASLQLSIPLGFQLDSGQQLRIESQQPVYAIAGVGIGQVQLGVLDEAWESASGY